MNWIQKTYLTLKTWVFKKKLLQFSSRYPRDPQACFYCPEMCRFSCDVAESIRADTVTPRGKMTLLHLMNQGYAVADITGSAEQMLSYLEQCTGCGKCTEYCLHEIDVASNLRNARQKVFSSKEAVAMQMEAHAGANQIYYKTILLSETGRKSWWESRGDLVNKIDPKIQEVIEIDLPHRDWSYGKILESTLSRIQQNFKNCKRIYIESPEVAWFFCQAFNGRTQSIFQLRRGFHAEIRLVWQYLFADFISLELKPDVLFHESYHLTRLLPRHGLSIPMYERGLLPFHHGWNVKDCGGEGHYRFVNPENAKKMGLRFLENAQGDGRKIDELVCQNLSCIEHLKTITDARVSYWLDYCFPEHLL